MKRVLIFSLGFLMLVILSWCAKQDQIDELQWQIYDLESENNTLKETIDECNSNIEDAQSYVWWDYEDMQYALEDLQTCDY